MLTIYINKKDQNKYHDQNIMLDMLTKTKLKFTVVDLNQMELNEIKKLAEEIRRNRQKFKQINGIENKWNFNVLTLPPIIKTDDNTYPWWHIREHMDEIIRKERIRPQTNRETTKPKRETTKPKLEIKRIRKRKTTTNEIEITSKSLARINVTMLRLINGIDPIDIMIHWSEEERASGMIMWRLAQHYKKHDMLILADMIKNKAEMADPYRKTRWVGDINNADLGM
jgi:hypothetical protein